MLKILIIWAVVVLLSSPSGNVVVVVVSAEATTNNAAAVQRFRRHHQHRSTTMMSHPSAAATALCRGSIDVMFANNRHRRSHLQPISSFVGDVAPSRHLRCHHHHRHYSRYYDAARSTASFGTAPPAAGGPSRPRRICPMATTKTTGTPFPPPRPSDPAARTTTARPDDRRHHHRPIRIPTSLSSSSSYTTTIPPITLFDDLNENQRMAVLMPRYSITRVVAGPGAGKTRVLTCRIAHLLLSSEEGEQRRESNIRNGGGEGILAVTFTKKSAMEMERRLLESLSSYHATTKTTTTTSTSTIATQSSSLSDDFDADPIDVIHEDNIDGDVDSSPRELMMRTTVGTFHSVCSKILRKFGKEMGNLPSVRGNLPGVETTTMNITSSSTGDGVRALDGSFNILDQSDQLRLLKDLLQRHNIELKSPAPSFANGGGGRGGGNEIRPVTILNAISLLNTRDATFRTSFRNTRGGYGENDDVDDIEGKMSKRVYKIAMEIRHPFQMAKYAQNSVDFDDLILLTRELLLHHPEVRAILHRRWRHVLVDEFQDTSRVQLDLVRLLTTNSLFVVGDGDQSIYSWRGACPESMTDFEAAFHDRPHGWEKLLHDQGNEDVSTYLERIGGIGRGLGRREGGDAPMLKVRSVYLMENYRSTTNIVRAAQRIISTTERIVGANDSPISSAQDDIRRDMKPMRGDGPSPRVLACKDGKAEAKFVVQTVNSMVDSGDISPSSTVAIIYRTNAQSRLIEEACVENNLRYVVRGSSGTFYKRTEIQDCLAFLKVMYNPRDRSAWARAVKAPSRGIGETSLDEFFRYCDAVAEKHSKLGRDGIGMPTPLDVLMSFAPSDGTTPIVDVAALVPPRGIVSTRSMNRFLPFASSLRSLRRKAEVQGVSDFLLSVIDDLGLKSHFDAISKTKDEYEDRLGNVMELVRAAERYKADGPCISGSSFGEPTDTPLGNFLDDVALIADIAPDESGSDDGGRIVANLMTIHSSKGMEFDAVFLVGNEEGTFPTQRSIAEAMFKSKDAVRSRFLDILVSKRGATRKIVGKLGAFLPKEHNQANPVH
ncbi:hypothetical protein ACHAXA_003885 [Cyclostephanos tholiformis]|uniref:DNA 3'-5' helicase n=1 Tax=Cyclostephanos tholiformis TaxID=382380 RepID=A0ABD3R9Q2_9STRA